MRNRLRAWWQQRTRGKGTPLRSLTLLEKIALIEVSAAASYKILLWSLGLTVESAPEELRVLFAVASFIAPELIVSAIVVAERRYGRTLGGSLTIVAAAAVSALIALSVEGRDLPGLTAAPALLLIPFALYLAGGRRLRAPHGRRMRPSPAQLPELRVRPPLALPGGPEPASVVRFPCSACGAETGSAGARLNTRKYGSCKACKVPAAAAVVS